MFVHRLMIPQFECRRAPKWLRGLANIPPSVKNSEVGNSGTLFWTAFGKIKIREKHSADNQWLPSRLLVSQDRHQIFLTLAQFDADYVDYICDNTAASMPPTQPSFLQMREYGPFDTVIDSHMKSLGRVLLAFCLRISEMKPGDDPM